MFKKFLATFFAIFALTHAYSDPNDVHAEILKFANQIHEDGNYEFAYDTSNGIAVQGSGVGGYYANGGYSYYSPEGELIQLSYSADENGFHPQGAHLPTPPPIPDQILKALEYIRTHPPYDESRQQSSNNYNSFGGRRRSK